MAWRDDKARATLIRDAAGSVPPGKSPRAFAEPLFSYTNIEDLDNFDAASLALLAEQAWEHVQRRTAGSADIRVVNPTFAERARDFRARDSQRQHAFPVRLHYGGQPSRASKSTLVAHPIIAVERDDEGQAASVLRRSAAGGSKGPAARKPDFTSTSTAWTPTPTARN